jgi:hypothetical protein
VWKSILKLSHKWDFDEVKAFAFRELELHEMPALEKIILYHTYDIDRKYLQAAYTELAVRDDPITIEEGHLLGLETALRLAHAREIARAPVFSGKKPGNPRSPINLAGSELDALISRLFNLSLPDATTEKRPSSPPPTPTGRGTPTGGRNTPQLGIQTNGTGSPTPNSARGGSVMNAYPPSSSHANLPVQVRQTGSMATQTETSTAEENKGAGRAAGVPNVPESKGKEAAAAAEASLDPVMHLVISKRDSMKRLFRIHISLSLRQRNQELALQRRRRPPRRKAPSRPLRL